VGEIFGKLTRSGITQGDKTKWYDSPEEATIAASRQLPSADEILGTDPLNPRSAAPGSLPTVETPSWRDAVGSGNPRALTTRGKVLEALISGGLGAANAIGDQSAHASMYSRGGIGSNPITAGAEPIERARSGWLLDQQVKWEQQQRAERERLNAATIEHLGAQTDLNREQAGVLRLKGTVPPPTPTLEQMYAQAIQAGDTEGAQRIAEAARTFAESKQREPADTQYSDWRKQNPNAPVSEYVKLTHPDNKPEGETGAYFPIVDEQGNLQTFFNPKSGRAVNPPVSGRKSPLSAAENVRRANSEFMLGKLNELEALAKQNPDAIGPVAGRLESLKQGTIGSTDAKTELHRGSNDLADMLLRARSGAQINEQEYDRLRRLVPNPNQPPQTFLSNLKNFRAELQSITNKSTGREGSTDNSSPKEDPFKAFGGSKLR